VTYNFNKVQILVIECSSSMLQLLKSVLCKLNVPVENIAEAYTTEEAFINFCASEYDLIITDWLENPDTGIEITKRIRREVKSPNPAIPIIMTAGSAHVKKVLKARDAGISDYLVKPFSANALVNTLERVIEDKRQFVIADSYVGPDRRRNLNPEYDGPERRNVDAFYV